MDKHRAYCSACDRQVDIVVKPGARTNPVTGEAEDEIICLEMGESCTGSNVPDVRRPDGRDEAERRATPRNRAELSQTWISLR